MLNTKRESDETKKKQEVKAHVKWLSSDSKYIFVLEANLLDWTRGDTPERQLGFIVARSKGSSTSFWRV